MLTPTLRHLFPGTLALSLLLTLSACGGSSGGGPGPRPQVQEDTSPAEFSFEAETGVEPGATVKASSFSVEGINVPVTVSVDGGEYAVNGDGSFTSESSEVRENDKIVLQATAPDEPGATKEVTLSVGDTSATWAITTLEDTEAPEAAFAFPPPMTATDAKSLTVRGTANDDYSAVASVTLTVESESGRIQTYIADTENDFEGWSKTVPLEQGDNQIRVAVEDAQGNTIEEADVVRVRRQPFAESFPDNEVPFTDIQDMTFDERRGRLLVPDQFKNVEGESMGQIIAIDLETSERTVFATDDASTNEDDALVFTYSITLDHEGERALLGVDTSRWARITSIDLETGNREVISRSSSPDFDQPTHDSVVGIVPDPESENHIYTLSEGDGNVLRINLSDGQKAVISSTEHRVGTGEDLIYTTGMVLLPDQGEFYITGRRETLFKVNLADGNREKVNFSEFPFYQGGSYATLSDIVSTQSGDKLYVSAVLAGIVSYDPEAQLWEPVKVFELDAKFESSVSLSLSLMEGERYLLFADSKTSGIYALDLETKEYVIVSKSVN